MSGGHFDYQQSRIKDIADEIEHQLSRNGETTEYGYRIEYSPETVQEFQNAVYQLRKAFVYAQRVDWLLEGDDCERDFHKRLSEELAALDRQNG